MLAYLQTVVQRYQQRVFSMINLKELPMFILLGFTLIYTLFGNPDSAVWSGLYFFINYLILLLLFQQHKDKYVRLLGISLSVSILLFIVLKYIFNLNINRAFSIIPFTISIVGLYYYEYKSSKKK